MKDTCTSAAPNLSTSILMKDFSSAILLSTQSTTTVPMHTSRFLSITQLIYLVSLLNSVPAMDNRLD